MSSDQPPPRKKSRWESDDDEDEPPKQQQLLSKPSKKRLKKNAFVTQRSTPDSIGSPAAPGYVSSLNGTNKESGPSTPAVGGSGGPAGSSRLSSPSKEATMTTIDDATPPGADASRAETPPPLQMGGDNLNPSTISTKSLQANLPAYSRLSSSASASVPRSGDPSSFQQGTYSPGGRRRDRGGGASERDRSKTADIGGGVGFVEGEDRKEKGKNKSKRNPRALHPTLRSCRSVYCFERLNHIEEGSYGVVFRARDRSTGEIVALKKLKMDGEKNGFPITSLREIEGLMRVSHHENVVRLLEIVVGDTLNQVFLVFEFIEHDLKSLLSSMRTPFLASEIKTILRQLLSAVGTLHDNWIVHRDLKSSNLLMNNRGQIKVADFGLARTYGDPVGDMTQLVVTLWYRAPEILLGATTYSTAVDMWSIGCIFGELILKEPLIPGKGEIDQLGKTFKLLGRPSEETWPGVSKLPNYKSINVASMPPYSSLRTKFRYTTEAGLDLMSKLLTYDPEKRITADEALKHPYFSEAPLPKHPDLFSSFPSIAAGERRASHLASPRAPERVADKQFGFVNEFDDLL